MPTTLTLDKRDLPLWSGGTGSLNVDIPVLSLNDPLTRTQPLMHLQFGVSGSDSIAFGRGDGLALKVKASTQANLTAVFPGAQDALLADNGLDGFLNSHPEDLMLALRLGSAAEAGGVVTVPYAELSVTGALDVGGDAGYTFLKPYPQNTPCGRMLKDFFGRVSLPSVTMPALEAGEALSYEFGGYLKFGASIALGYEIKGTPGVEWGKPALSEHYGFSALGSISGSAKVAGRFRVDVRGVDTPDAAPAGTRWVQVIVRRTRSREAGVAADVKVELENTLQELPNSGVEFLGAVLGVNSKSWFNYLMKVSQARSFADLESVTDTLAQSYLAALLNKTFDQIEGDLAPALDQIRTVVDAYQQFDNRAINLFDRYYDRVPTVLHSLLTQVSKLDSWNELIGKPISGELAQVIAALTGSDPTRPLSWIVAMASEGDLQGLQGLRKRADDILTKIDQGAHQAIINAIKVAKEQFGLDALLQQLAQIDTPEKLEECASTKLGGLASRLLGKALENVRDTKEMQSAWKTLQRVAGARQRFEQELYQSFRDAVNSTYTLSLHTAYSRASEDDHLINALFNLESKAGRELFQSACRGDFSGLLEALKPDRMAADPFAVLLQEGVFTHTVSKSGSFKVNIVGWHDRFRYENSGFDKVVVNTRQQIRAGKAGMLTVYTQTDLSQERQRRSGLLGKEEEVYTKFLVHFAAASNGAVEVDKRTSEYLMDAVEAVSATYGLTLAAEKATRQQLEYYLHFANDFGVSLGTMTYDQIAALLPHQEDDFGSIEADYGVEYTAEGVKRAWSGSVADDVIRGIMRRIVLRSYARDGANTPLADIGRAYATEAVHRAWALGQMAFTNQSGMQVSPATAIPGLGQQQANISLHREQLQVIHALYSIEQSFVEAFLALKRVIDESGGGKRPVSPRDFARTVERFGAALGKFDSFAENDKYVVNPVFVLFDQLVRQGSPAAELRKATLELTGAEGGQTVHQLYLSPPAAAAAAGSAGGRLPV